MNMKEGDIVTHKLDFFDKEHPTIMLVTETGKRGLIKRKEYVRVVFLDGGLNSYVGSPVEFELYKLEENNE